MNSENLVLESQILITRHRAGFTRVISDGAMLGTAVISARLDRS